MQFIREALAAGSNPTIAPSGATVLKHGRSFRNLVTPGGKLTAAGRLYENEAASKLEVKPYATGQAPRRDNDTEWITLRGGDERVVRRYDSAAQKFKYTALGREFFSSRRTEWVVRVPAVYSGTRANGNPYTRNGWHPIQQSISLPVAWSQAQRDRKIRRTVADMYPNSIIAEYSGERISIREGQPWNVVEMTTTPGAGAADPTTSVMQRPLGTLPPSISSLPMPEHICEAAFQQHPDNLCVPRQIALVRKRKFDAICNELDECGPP